MIALIIFVLGDLCIFYERSRDLYHDSFDHFCFRWILHFQRETCRRCGKTAMIPLIIFFCREFGSPGRCHPKTACEKSARKKTAGEKAPSQYCRWKICRWEGVKNLQVRRCHPNTARGSKAPSQNCTSSMQFGLGTPRMPMCGKLRYSFRCTLILSCARTFLQQKPVLKDIFSPARLQHINVNMLRIFVIEDAFLP